MLKTRLLLAGRLDISIETSLHTSIITNVDLMLQLNEELDAATLPDQREQLKARIGHPDEKINRFENLMSQNSGTRSNHNLPVENEIISSYPDVITTRREP
jgi:hypothetical protein